MRNTENRGVTPRKNQSKLNLNLEFTKLYFFYLPLCLSTQEAFLRASYRYYELYGYFKFSSINQFNS